MEELFSGLGVTTQALIATVFTWGITALGAAVVLFFKRINKTAMDSMLSCAAGVMLAAAFWSLLAPSIQMSETLGINPWLTALFGFVLGGFLLYAGEKLFSFFSRNKEDDDNEFCGSRKRCMMLIFSITLHNIPEGLAIGVAFGSVAYGLEGAGLTAAWLLALGIGLQNFPEGTAVSVPLRREGMSRWKAFFYGQLSAIVEPIAGVLGALLVLRARLLLPYLLAFAAGAMVYVVVQELIPESQTNPRPGLMTLFTLLGFAVMMVLDVALG